MASRKLAVERSRVGGPDIGALGPAGRAGREPAEIGDVVRDQAVAVGLEVLARQRERVLGRLFGDARAVLVGGRALLEEADAGREQHHGGDDH